MTVSLHLVTQARFPASREVPAHGFGLLGAVRRRGNVIIPFSHSPHPSLQAINSRLIVFKAAILWLTDNNDNDDSNEAWTSCLLVGGVN